MGILTGSLRPRFLCGLLLYIAGMLLERRRRVTGLPVKYIATAHRSERKADTCHRRANRGRLLLFVTCP